jgi:murein DD-endopeptidase MepM/ murein hydrolase activator NlpD
MNNTLANALQNTTFANVIDNNLFANGVAVLDLTEKNKHLAKIDISNAEEFSNHISKIRIKSNVRVCIGKYAEDRTIYAHSPLFNGTNPRTVHLGIDLWVEPGTKVFAPADGSIHSFANNKGIGDYGPTIIIEHSIDEVQFFTLYGHLSLDSLENLKVGKKIKKGNIIGTVGNYPDNGNWPSHLHFQIIADMLGKKGDFFGVASVDKLQEFIELCPDPNLMLRIKSLSSQI